MNECMEIILGENSEWYLLDKRIMYKNNKQAFTFVELIVVITILVILSVIWLWAYQSYIWDSRDTNRLVQINDIYEGMYTYSLNARLPFPDNSINIQANWDTFVYQWFAGENVINTIWYDGWWKDIESGIYLSYMLWVNQKDFQLMTYVNESEFLSSNIIWKTYANQDYVSMFPKVTGQALWILVEDATNAPIQEINSILSAGAYDIISWGEELTSYLSDNEKISTKLWQDISFMIPNKSCKRLLELWKSKWNGKYIISQDWSTKIQVYCDMEIEGGWWTFAGFVDETTKTSEIRFSTWTWVYSSDRIDTWEEYFIAMDWLWHTEMMALIETRDPLVANENNQFLKLKYGLDAEMFHTDDLMNCSDNFGKTDWYFHQMYLWKEYIWSNVWDCASSWWWLRPIEYNPGGTYLLRTRDTGWSTFWTEWRPQAWTQNGWDTSEWYGHKFWIYVR